MRRDYLGERMTEYVITGIVLDFVAINLIIHGAASFQATCAKTAGAARLFGLPLCSQLFDLGTSLLIGAVPMLVVGAVFLRWGTRPRSPWL